MTRSWSCRANALLSKLETLRLGCVQLRALPDLSVLSHLTEVVISYSQLEAQVKLRATDLSATATISSLHSLDFGKPHLDLTGATTLRTLICDEPARSIITLAQRHWRS